MYTAIKALLGEKFAPWEIEFSDEDLFGGKKTTKEWNLRWAIDEDERGIYIEYYGIHRGRGHLHGRIYEDGYEEPLEVLKEYIAYCPNIPGDRERSTQAFEIYNRDLMTDLREKRLI